MKTRMPVAYVPHAGGPAGHVELGWPRTEIDSFVSYWQSLRHLPATTPEAVLVISAHWEAPVPTVMSASNPAMYYDYAGFPAEAYRIAWPAPGHPALAARVRALLAEAGFETESDAERGYDHGTFVPLKIAYPSGVPVIQLSLIYNLDAAQHLRMGRALAMLRDEGVFIIGSGNPFHNMRGFSPAYREISERFNAWLTKAVSAEAAHREKLLADWASAPHARQCHPREEHLLPLMVIAGAAGEDTGVVTWTGLFLGVQQIGYHFGATPEGTVRIT